MSGAIKTVAFFDHLPSRSAEDCNRHYTRIHVPFIVGMMETTGIGRVYRTAEAEAQRDLNGGWGQRPDIWRSVSIKVAFTDGGGEMPERSRLAIEEDHRRFLCNLRTYVCREEILHEDLSGRPTTTKFALEMCAGEGREAPQGDQLDALVDDLREVASDSDGVALVVANRVRRQEQARAIDERGQGFTPGVFLDHPDVTAIFELYFVSRREGERCLDRLWPRLADHADLGDPRAYRLAEVGQLERRDPTHVRAGEGG